MPIYFRGKKKNESDAITKELLSLQQQDGQSASIQRDVGTRLIASYTKARANNDYKNRQRGLEKLEKK